MNEDKFVKYLNRVSVMLVAEPMHNYCINDSFDAKQMLQEYMNRFDREHFVALFLNRKQQVQAIHEVSVGTLSKALVHPREVFKAAILANADRIIVGHNHPSGAIEPSDEDIIITERLREAGQIIGIPVCDHLIVGGTAYYSFAENGLMGDVNGENKN